MSFVEDAPDAQSDLDGLRAFDTNGDGLLSAGDEMFSDFKVWRDENGDGRVSGGEILALPEIGLVSIALAGTAVGSTIRAGDVAVLHGRPLDQVRWSYDVVG